jgi:methionine-rich copper-binding protein CopC
MRKIQILAVALFLTVISTTSAYPHAQLQSTNLFEVKKYNLTKEITLSFNEEITVSKIQVIDQLNKEQKIKVVHNSNLVTVSLKYLKKGRYILRYSIISSDGHNITGSSGLTINTVDPKGKEKLFTISDLNNTSNFTLAITAPLVGNREISLPKKDLEILSIKLTHIKSKITINTLKTQYNTYLVNLPLSGQWAVEVHGKKTKFEEEMYYSKIQINNK